ncbi:MAG: FAD-dependent oxidoreductase, partial [Actinomyces urogenitalis]|uniref:FAD-dependent oxidoreductase n=2 Tax=Actinomyces TaxID=1654 RepID=UPI002A8414C7
CAQENEIVSRIHSSAVERVGGLFVVTPEDDLAFSDDFIAGARATGVPAEEISLSEALRLEPRLNPGIKRAFRVHDGAVDGWQMVWGAARSAQAYGAQVLTYHEVTDVIVEGEGQGRRVVAVRARGVKTGEELTVSCRMLMNAAGPWGGRLATMAGSTSVKIAAGRGVMIAMNHRLVNHVVNRCVHPADGDIIVPDHTVSIIGTTDRRAEDPDHLAIPRQEVAQMLDAGEVLIPGFRQVRALHAWAGARPLVLDTSVSSDDTRHMSRGMTVISHARAEGLAGMITVAGGKLTTYRLMAQHAVDAMCAELGVTAPCRTAQEEVPGSVGTPNYHITHRLGEREDNRLADQTICECELVGRKAVTDLMEQQPDASFDDLRRQLRVAMGPCQGGFCAPRVAGLRACCSGYSAADASESLKTFLRHRWIGLWTILHGEQVRETALDFWMLQGTLDIEDLPQAPAPSAVATALVDAEDGMATADEQAAAEQALSHPPVLAGSALPTISPVATGTESSARGQEVLA